ncbi:hypothetical protein [Streptococcus lutetiensis]|uniref:hypothetical protein n=1 Tax=Streptococcus lutetiensis TaxID=150055 RepID=UPI0019663A30|nr:hypothetical protein [Streptococcus lutetiensis]
MIIFPNLYYKKLNYIVHHFLDCSVFLETSDVGDWVEDIFPKYLYREQFQKCETVLNELYDWTTDPFTHQMTAFHELALFYFLELIQSEQEEDREFFKEIYFDEESSHFIQEIAKEDFEEFGDDEMTQEDFIESYFEVTFYQDILFDDWDFLLLPTLQTNRFFDYDEVEARLGINIDYYKELLPQDIGESYKSNITLTGDVSEFINFFNKRCETSNLYKLFWEGNKPVKEEKIQIVIDNMMNAYFRLQGVEINREVNLGNGQVDFKLYRNNDYDEKVLIEIKKASSSYLKKGYEKQLTGYLKASNYKNAFYLIACFTDQEYKLADDFIHSHVYTDSYQLYINIAILDLRVRQTASKK